MTESFAGGRDAEHLAWCAVHPDGFVVNTTIPPTPKASTWSTTSG